MMFLKSFILAGTALATLASPAAAQIQIDELTPASAYDAGILDQNAGGLDSALWQGTSAARAVVLIKKLDKPLSSTAQDLARAALLSGGVPPEAADGLDREAYLNARLSAILASGNIAEFDQLVSSGSYSEADPAFRKIFVERSLLGGHTDKACSITDGITADRALPYWAKIRAYCHFVRGELPAAELTMDLIKRGGHKDQTFNALIGSLLGTNRSKPKLSNLTSPLNIALARDVLTAAEKSDFEIENIPALLAADIAQNGNYGGADRFVAFKASAHLLSVDQIRNVLAGFGGTVIDSGINPADKNSWIHSDWGQAFIDLKSNNDMTVRAQIAAQMLIRAEKLGLLAPMAKALEQDTSFIPASLQASADPLIFANVAVMNNDLGALGGLYQSLPEDDESRGRIALASDALGGGFTQAPLGTDIESRLALTGAAQKRAIRDTFVAVALGANMSDTAIEVIDGRKTASGSSLPEGSLLALQAVAKRGSKAESALRTASMMGSKSLSDLRNEDLSLILSAFRDASMYQTAGRLAAAEFLSGK
ncbi:MAG: hypothetical protein HKO02_02480 [Hyphomonadaceae bacterium]|nr:hypothetical protein [Hyphomonadaceae bacterium]